LPSPAPQSKSDTERATWSQSFATTEEEEEKEVEEEEKEEEMEEEEGAWYCWSKRTEPGSEAEDGACCSTYWC